MNLLEKVGARMNVGERWIGTVVESATSVQLFRVVRLEYNRQVLLRLCCRRRYHNQRRGYIRPVNTYTSWP